MFYSKCARTWSRDKGHGWCVGVLGASQLLLCIHGAPQGPGPQKQWRIQVRFSDGFYKKWHAKREVDAFLKERDG